METDVVASKVTLACDHWFEEFYLVRGDRPVSSQIERLGCWEYLATEFLTSIFTTKSGSFYDVGANLGWFSCLALKANLSRDNSWCIYSFEPHHQLFSIMLKNASLINCTSESYYPYCAALGDANKLIGLSVPIENKGDIRIDSVNDNDCVGIQYKLSDFLVDGKLSVFKIDVQGSEYRVLEDLTPSLRQHDAGAIILVEIETKSHDQARKVIEHIEFPVRYIEPTLGLLGSAPDAETLLKLIKVWPRHHIDIIYGINFDVFSLVSPFSYDGAICCDVRSNMRFDLDAYSKTSVKFDQTATILNLSETGLVLKGEIDGVARVECGCGKCLSQQIRGDLYVETNCSKCTVSPLDGGVFLRNISLR